MCLNIIWLGVNICKKLGENLPCVTDYKLLIMMCTVL